MAISAYSSNKAKSVSLYHALFEAISSSSSAHCSSTSPIPHLTQFLSHGCVEKRFVWKMIVASCFLFFF